ncbi:MAG TPA: hypothetical protein VK936_00830 [Longimicrobiales bacterium]|nr:hypothetical protein [Longimicrobiales bacterium]
MAALTALLLDLDRATVTDGPASGRARDRMLDRLHRSRRKIESATGRRAGAAELAALDAALAGGVPA